MAAFEAAVNLGYRYLETDVHATSDGYLIAFHNRRLDDVTDRRGVVEQLSWDEVRCAKVNSREPIPLLEEVLGSWPELRVNIDPKSDSAVEPLIGAIRRSNALERVCIGSFSKRRITRLREALGAKLCTSLGPLDAIRLFLAAQGGAELNFSTPCAQIPAGRGPFVICSEKVVAYAHAHRMKVHAWTVNNREEMTRLLDIGIDGLMTDCLLDLRALLKERGEWYTH
jgi:glycerophosphoryl diester phosphodiesterase